MKIQKTLIAMAVALGLSTCAYADLLYTFDTGPSGADGGTFNGGTYTWSATYQAVQATTTVGGWTTGGAGPKWEFSWPSQSAMVAIANDTTARLAFDVFVNDATSFNWWNNPDPLAQWYQIWATGNSDGVGGWSQNQVYAGTYVIGGGAANDVSVHVDMAFASFGFNPGDSWFQVFFGANSDALNGLEFYIDNINVYTVPEPSSFALLGLGTAALLAFRRRK